VLVFVNSLYLVYTVQSARQRVRMRAGFGLRFQAASSLCFISNLPCLSETLTMRLRLCGLMLSVLAAAAFS
ncbi:hypothetical protein, partial [Eikenella sp. HMSC073A11]|uniref:hypothetical protein n=1 Tax=Eikenella sp. HMSC073A11 TaxID=1739535 RepID=UPI001AEF5713